MMFFRLSERTYSLWGYMANHMNEYINPLYSGDDKGIVVPVLHSQNIRYIPYYVIKYEKNMIIPNITNCNSFHY